MSAKDMREGRLSSPSEARTRGDTLTMAGKVVLITGGTGGIGKATAIGLARLGARVGITGRDFGRAEQAAADIRATSGSTAVDAFAAGSAGSLVAPVEPDELAFLQFTSGSTSRPKGVMVTHGNILGNSIQIDRAIRQTAESVVPSISDQVISQVIVPATPGHGRVLQACASSASGFAMVSSCRRQCSSSGCGKPSLSR